MKGSDSAHYKFAVFVRDILVGKKRLKVLEIKGAVNQLILFD
jgi:hypothetical protein